MNFYHGYQPRSSFFQSLSLGERVLLVLAGLLVIVGLTGFVRSRSVEYEVKPIQSGTYNEGVVVDSPTKVERVLARLTNVGLTYRDVDGTIKPALAEKWDITNDNKTYTFHLREGVDATNLLSIIQSSKTNWSSMDIKALDAQTLQFNLSESLGIFLSTTTTPLFPMGPYEVVKRSDKEVILRSKENFVLGAPYIPKIVIKQFDSVESLTNAAVAGEVDGSADFTDLPNSRFHEYVDDLPRYHILFVNAAKPAFKKVDDRLRVLQQKDGNPVTYNLLTSQSSDSATIADALVNKLAEKKITLNVTKKNGTTLQKEDLPKREYDLLLYGVNYGVDRDYYPFWHSSQATSAGLNLANVKDKELDKQLESARREIDPLKRRELNAAIETYLSQQGYQQIVSQEKSRFWVIGDVKGVEYGTINETNDRFNLVWKWYTKTKKVPVNTK